MDGMDYFVKWDLYNGTFFLTGVARHGFNIVDDYIYHRTPAKPHTRPLTFSEFTVIFDYQQPHSAETAPPFCGA